MLLAALIGICEAAHPNHEVLVLHTADPEQVEALRVRFARTGLLHDTDPWDLDTEGVPVLDTLDTYDAVLLWLEEAAPEPDVLGDTLADFVDLRGGGVVLAGPTCAPDHAPGGRFSTGGMAPWSFGLLASSDGEHALPNGPDHDLHGALGTLDAGSSTRCLGLVVPGPVPLVWDDGAPLVVLHPRLRLAGVNLWPPADALDPPGWEAEGQGSQVLVRTLMWSAGWDWPEPACRRETSEADRNCNAILRSDELLVDVSAPGCDATLDADGLPLASHDDYIEPELYGCDVPVTTALDGDRDGLGAGLVTLQVDGLPWADWWLECDSCPDIYDPLRFDFDCDEVGDLCDACPYQYGEPFVDTDGDQIFDDCDNCELLPNGTQDNEDDDRFGNPCDLCPFDTDPAQRDADHDGLGDVCDPCPELPGDASDADGDGVGDRCDLCPDSADADQSDRDLDGVGDVCDICPLNGGDQVDRDGDGLGDRCDTCPALAGAPQLDSDDDGRGDACDPCPFVADERTGDLDLDEVPDVCDLCIRTPDPRQRDTDGDGVGNACDLCPDQPDPDQNDHDADGLGDACDVVSIRGGGALCDATGGGGGLLGLAFVWSALRRRRGR